MNCLYISDINPILVLLFANIFSYSVGCLLILLMISFAVQMLLCLIRFHFKFCFYFPCFRRHIKKILLQFMSKSVPPVFLKEFYDFWYYSLHLFLYLVLGNVLIPFFSR